MELSGPWKLQHFEVGEKPAHELAARGLDDRFWIDAAVPGDVHSALLERSIIDPPYFGHNDAKCRWIEHNEWWYRTPFTLDAAPEQGERIELKFEGLDTFAAVYVNGHEIGRTANMFREYVFDVTRIVREGWNVLAVRFDPLHLHHRDKEQLEWSSYTKERPWIRKAAMNFGWDWGPRIVTAGIWGKVRLTRRKLAKLTGVYACTRSVESGEAVLHFSAEAEAFRKGTQAEVVVRLLDAEGLEAACAVLAVPKDRQAGQGGAAEGAGSLVGEGDDGGSGVSSTGSDGGAGNTSGAGSSDGGLRCAGDSGGESSLGSAGANSGGTGSGTAHTHGAGRAFGRAETELRVRAPRLWWTHDLGEPYLYTLEVVLRAEGEEVDRCIQPFGIRTLELALRNGEGGNAFAFILNGVKVYAKGANWIPADNLIGSISESTYRGLIDLAVEGNMNMLRVWAGGIYEKDVFYDECDRQGVLVWQDFAFANALFPDFNQDFMDNVRHEVIDNVKRLRNRASLALWCGNNEIDWLYDMKSAAGDITGPFFGERIYHELIPEVLAELDPARPYWPSSPYGASGGYDANDPHTGDRHNWQVWHGSVYPRMQGEKPRLDYSVEGVTFKKYKQDFALFSSEFGMHAAANRYTLEKNIPAGQFVWGSAEMAYRNKDTNHRKGILLMEGYTGIPRDIEEYMDFSMLTQAEGLKYGIEHFRRNRHRNSGALVWQLNDSWPGTSWSMIDYELLPKASFYYAKTFYNPVLLSLEHEPGEPLKVWVVNDTLEPLRGTVELTVHALSGGGVLSRAAFAADIPPQSTVRIGALEEAAALRGAAPEEVAAVLTASGFAAPANRYYLRDPKDLRLPETRLDVRVDEAAQTATVTAAGPGAARFVKLELPLGRVRYSDNYFDLLPGESRTVHISHPKGQLLPWAKLRVSALNGKRGTCGI
ncbi:MAG: glycoside hydrolase family 2 protein [Paenibacillus macerans]|uniref:Beta-mannosidase B n=5 Tax=Paenibacillus macerans TaxID=44252 RepID=A0A090ZA10_PAEMA|nr:glycoside hydrolase family 2 protein [Paenibacillus macerans]KFN07045.1 glycosyl hydrolases 2 family protein [Paenibacillus macerans]MCY7560617.1 beta galactosidase jelly roll domain-containing protein [Paenibacillus macerans]MDU7473679.1 glycoside hydrolase family 2 protein [Paenibacillus macerans]MUG25555.1 glycoside hydrolase family 2 protein [Paenibacillus macerans]UMV49495.1 beta galactosidase jelly roll domain-containing protein [Paenibacillus macerans]